MAVRKVIKMGNPLLLKISEPVTVFNEPELDALVTDLFDTMAKYEGAGLAAPQIAVLKRVIIFGVENSSRYPDAEPIPTTVLINPAIKFIGDTMDEDWEGCLSVPGMRGLVPRHTKISYSGFDQYGEKIEHEVEGFHARVVQHECDHLDGVLYSQRIIDMRQFGFEEELFKEDNDEKLQDVKVV